MADKIPLKAIFTGSDVTALGEMAAGDTVPIANGGTGAVDATTARANLFVPYQISYTSALRVSAGTTAQRNGSPSSGDFRFNLDLTRFEGYNGTAWGSLGGATGGGTDAVFYEADITINSSYTVTTNRNAVVPSPTTIAAGAVVTVNAGSTLTFV